MASLVSKAWTLASRPVGAPKSSDFQQVSEEAGEPADGQIQVRNSWMSVDPYMRGRMIDRKSYVPPFKLGEVMQGGAVGRVVASKHPGFADGDLVLSNAGWREAWTADPQTAGARKLVSGTGLPDSAFLGVAGMPGLTAYAGILRVAELKEGDVVFVSGAAGAVGSAVVQIAKIKNCRVIGSAGGAEKCAYVESLGADACVDYRAVDGYDGLLAALRGAAPKGIDVYFDNVGGDHLQAAIEVSRPFGRMAICGMISQYNDTEPAPGPKNLIQVVGKQLQLRGFIVTTHADLQSQFIKDMTAWISTGKMAFEETVFEGIDSAPDAFMGLFSGKNKGKMVVKLS